ncbi:MAG TPA: hypothetical protein DIT64_00925 [Verrucomicrobiales bacterium]|nr:hypothetical protein [Verrucomicrobiales bacterium]
MSDKDEPDYVEELRRAKSLLISSELRKRRDVAARQCIESFNADPGYEPLHGLMIERRAWEHVERLGVPAKLVFCHPAILMEHPRTSLYYRGMAGLSIKAAKDYCGNVERLEQGGASIPEDKALRLARGYNIFICSIIVNSTAWTLENGHRNIIATMGISLDGSMRNKVGEIGEDRVRRMVVLWLIDKGLVADAGITVESIESDLPDEIALDRGILMRFASEPDITFEKAGVWLATVEIKGGIDPAGALERYGAAKKSFEHAVNHSRRCRNFYIGGVLTPELKRRIRDDRLVEKTFSMIELLQSETAREAFCGELFHHTLRLV